MTSFFPILIILLSILAIIIICIFGRFVSLWFQAFVSGTPISIFSIIGMTLRKIPPRLVVESRIALYKAGLKEVSVSDIETHYLAGGHVKDVVLAMISASKANIELSWKSATAIDLAGRDIKEAVATSVYPKVIDCPKVHHGEKVALQAVAKNGIQLLVTVRVTVRCNIEQLVGGATEDTVIARVGEGIVSAIGSSETHLLVLENPDRISKAVLSKGLDAGTAFEILSIDIADIDVGENIGAELQKAQAKADKEVAQAKAEARRAMAVAREQEMSAEVVEKKAKLVEAEAEVPRAIADAFRSGNLGIMDYYKMNNIKADTSMRQSIAKEDKKDNNEH